MYIEAKTKVSSLLWLKKPLKYIVRQDTCQLMVIDINSTPKGIPNFGCDEEQNFIQCKQLSYDIGEL